MIIRPDVYARDKAIVVESPFLLVEGWLRQDGVTAIKAERLQRLEGLLASMAVESHDSSPEPVEGSSPAPARANRAGCR